MVKKLLGTAHNGLSDWYWQRLSAVVLLLLVPLPFILIAGVYSGALDQFGLLDWLDNIVSRVLHTLLIFALVVHAYMGVKIILEDYAHHFLARVALVGGMLVTLAGFAIWWLALIWAWGG